jgi:hypothetical protein
MSMAFGASTVLGAEAYIEPSSRTRAAKTPKYNLLLKQQQASTQKRLRLR